LRAASGHVLVVGVLLLQVNRSLMTLDLDGNVPIPVGELRNNSMTRLDLSNRRLSDLSAICIAALLTINTSLLELNLAQNTLDASGSEAVAQALKVPLLCNDLFPLYLFLLLGQSNSSPSQFIFKPSWYNRSPNACRLNSGLDQNRFRCLCALLDSRTMLSFVVVVVVALIAFCCR
jgi:hypothetical protein